MTLYHWSRTAGTNATADSTINWAEGQAPSSINDSARAMMAATAEYRDDIAGAIVTAGTSTAYTVTSYQVFDTLAHLSGQMIAFSPHATNGATVTLNVDGLGAKPLRTAPNAELLAGVLIQGTPYIATYNNADGAFYLKGFYGNPYNIPLGASLDFWLPTAPNSSFAFPYGQAISRTTYAALFSAMGTTFGTGDGSTTFNIPDLRGRAVASPDNMGGSDAARLSNSNITGVRTTLGGAGGEAVHALIVGEIPSITSANASQAISVIVAGNQSFPAVAAGNTIGTASVGGAGGIFVPTSPSNTWGGQNTSSGNNSISVTSTNTSGTAHNVVQPTILANRIMRII